MLTKLKDSWKVFNSRHGVSLYRPGKRNGIRRCPAFVKRFFLTGLFLLSTLTIFTVPASFRISFIDVGYGDAILLEFPGGDTVLVDSGKPETAETVCRFLTQKEIEKLDICIGTHIHIDHIGGFPRILRYFKPSKLILNRDIHTLDEPSEFAYFLEETGRPYQLMKRGDKLAFPDGAFLECLHPADLSGDLNRDSLVLMAESPGCRFLLMADALGPSEEEILAAYPGAKFSGILVLKAGHHGWGDTNRDAFIEAVSPKLAVISTGPSEWPLPPPWITDRFRRRGIPLLRTDHLGTIEMACDGEILEVRAGGKIIGMYASACRAVEDDDQ